MIKKYLAGEAFLILLIYLSFLIINYTIFQGYILASIVFVLAATNFFILHNYEVDFPFIRFMVFKKYVKFENYRMALFGALFLAISLIVFYLDRITPFSYISFSTGMFFFSCVRIKLM